MFFKYCDSLRIKKYYDFIMIFKMFSYDCDFFDLILKYSDLTPRIFNASHSLFLKSDFFSSKYLNFILEISDFFPNML